MHTNLKNINSGYYYSVFHEACFSTATHNVVIAF